MQLVPDVVRDIGAKKSLRALEESAECREFGVIGLVTLKQSASLLSLLHSSLPGVHSSSQEAITRVEA